jgi:hypothetical protein
MCKRSTIFLILIIFTLNSIAQAPYYDIKPPSFLTHFLKNAHRKGTEIIIRTPNCLRLPIEDKNLSKSQQFLVFVDSNTFITLDGTGILYQLKGVFKDGNSRFIRVDSTIHSGNNFRSLSFGYDKNLYNIGGYGFWRTNGQLRLFTFKTNDWTIEPLNKEVLIDKEGEIPFLWYDEFNAQIIALESKNENQTINGKFQYIDSVYKLDLNTKTWITLGKLDKDIKEDLSEKSLLTNTEFGLLIHNSSKIITEIWDINNNQVINLSKEFQNKLPVSNLNNYIIWYEKPNIFIYDKSTDKIDSLLFTSEILTRSKHKIYENEQLSNTVLLSLLFITIILISTFFLFNKSKEKENVNIQNKELNPALASNSLFTEIEKTLLSLIISNIKENNRLTSIDEVNYILGISNKSINMQKRTRSDIISSINSKYQIYFKTDTPLILRQNSEMDQRVKEFYIEDGNINKISSLI